MLLNSSPKKQPANAVREQYVCFHAPIMPRPRHHSQVTSTSGLGETQSTSLHVDEQWDDR